MRSHKSIVFLVAVMSAITLIIAAPPIGSQGLEKDKPTAITRIRSDLPVVDFTTAASAPISAKRRANSRRYDLNNGSPNPVEFELKESDRETSFALEPSHGPERVAIPASQSDVVVIGEVLSTEAHLSNDRTGVYSEFNVRIDEVLKNASERSVFPGSSLATERRGGAVRFRSGKILQRGVFQETMPLAGGRYIFFLRSQRNTENFSIITGYNLREGLVHPLDGMNQSPALPQFAVYEGVKEEAFVTEVRSALAVPVNTQKLTRLVCSPGTPEEVGTNLPVDNDPPDPPDPGATPTPCVTPTTSSNGRNGAWPQNAAVSVIIQVGPGHFTAAQAACLTTAFTNWNAANTAGGNASGVRFNVTTNATGFGTLGTNGAQTTAWPDNVFQVSRGTPTNPLATAVTGGQGNTAGNARVNAATIIHAEVGTDVSFGCESLTETMAHEIGHTFGLDHCAPGTPNCNLAGSSVMTQAPCGIRNSDGVCIQPAYDDVSHGTPGPRPCYNNKAKEVGQYNPATTNQPAPPSTGGSGGGGGGGGGGYSCTPYFWVYYESWDNGETWQEVDRWFAGCW